MAIDFLPPQEKTLILYIKRLLLFDARETYDTDYAGERIGLCRLYKYSYNNATVDSIICSLSHLYENDLLATLSLAKVQSNYHLYDVDVNDKGNYSFLMRARQISEDINDLQNWRISFKLANKSIIKKCLLQDVDDFKSLNHDLLIYAYEPSLAFIQHFLKKQYESTQSVNYYVSINELQNCSNEYYDDSMSGNSVDILRTLLAMEVDGYIEIIGFENKSVEVGEDDNVYVRMRLLPSILSKLKVKKRTSTSQPEVTFNEHSGKIYINGSYVKTFDIEKSKYNIVSELVSNINESIPREKVIELLKLRKELDKTTRSYNTQEIISVVKDLRKELGLDSQTLTNNNGHLALFGSKV